MLKEDQFWNEQGVVDLFKRKPCSKYITDEICKLERHNNIRTVLDIGCGGGRYARYMSEKGFNVFALDKNLAMIEATQNQNIRTLQCDMTKIPLKGQKFDLILCIGVLHNATSRSSFIKAIKEIKRLINKGGHIIISIFTKKVISDDLIKVSKNKYKIKNGKPPMMLYEEKKIIYFFEKYDMKITKVIDEHITNVGTGERDVLSLCFKRV